MRTDTTTQQPDSPQVKVAHTPSPTFEEQPAHIPTSQEELLQKRQLSQNDIAPKHKPPETEQESRPKPLSRIPVNTPHDQEVDQPAASALSQVRTMRTDTTTQQLDSQSNRVEDIPTPTTPNPPPLSPEQPAHIPTSQEELLQKRQLSQTPPRKPETTQNAPRWKSETLDPQ